MLRILDIRDRIQLEHDIEELTSEMNSRFDDVETKHQRDITNLTNKHNTDKNQLQTNINELTNTHNTDKTQLQANIDELTSTHNTDKNQLQANINKLEITHINDKSELSAAIDTEKSRAEAAESNLNEKINSLDSKHEADKKELQENINLLTSTHNSDKNQLQTNINELETTHNTDKDALETKIASLTQTVVDNKAETSNAITSEKTRAEGVETSLEKRIATMEAFFHEADIDAKQEFIDTLKEIQDYIASDKTGASAMAASIKNNSDAIAEEKTRAETAEAKVLADTKAYSNELKSAIDTAYVNADEQVLSNAKSYTDNLANGQVAVNTESISTLAETKIDKDGDKVLTDNNLTDDLKMAYDAAYEHSQHEHAPVDAEKNIQSDWLADETSSAHILNKPTLGVLASKDTIEKTDLSEEVQTLLGQTVSMQVLDGYIQYSVDGGVTWINLLALSDITV